MKQSVFVLKTTLNPLKSDNKHEVQSKDWSICFIYVLQGFLVQIHAYYSRNTEGKLYINRPTFTVLIELCHITPRVILIINFMVQIFLLNTYQQSLHIKVANVGSLLERDAVRGKFWVKRISAQAMPIKTTLVIHKLPLTRHSCLSLNVVYM